MSLALGGADIYKTNLNSGAVNRSYFGVVLTHGKASEEDTQEPVYDYYVSELGDGVGTIEDPMSFADSQTTINSMTSGQSIAYKGGDEFYGVLDIQARDGITITSYGTGQASISNLTLIASWVNEGSNIWSSVQDTVYQVPGYNNAVSQDYTITAGGTTTFISTELIGHADIVGGSVLIRNEDWFVNIREVTAFNSTTGLVTIESAITYGYDVGNTFKIYNHASVCDTQGEWYYDGTKVYIYSTEEPTNVVVAIGTGDGISIAGSTGVTIDNLKVEGFNDAGIKASTSEALSVINSTIEYCYNEGITIEEGSDHVVNGNTVSNIMKRGIELNGTVGTGSVFSFNNVSNVGLESSFTYYDAWSTLAIDIQCIGATINNNIVTNVGYIGINLPGKDTVTEYNYVENYCQYLYDGGGIYTWSDAFDSDRGYNATIRYNTVITNDVNREGTTIGIYIDDRARNATIYNNSIQGGGAGIFLHNTQDASVYNNNIHKSRKGIRLLENISNGIMTGNTLDDNAVLIATNKFDEACLTNRSTFDNTNTYTGTGNKYYNLGWTHPTAVMTTTIYYLNSQYQLPYLIADTPRETGQTGASTQATQYTIDSYDTANLVANSDFSSGITGWSTLGTGGSISDGGGYLTLDPLGDSSISIGNNGDRISVIEGEYYEAEFKIRTQGTPHWGRLNMQMTGSPYESSRVQPIWIDGTWTTQKFVMYMDFSGDDVRFEWFNMDGSNGFDLDDVIVRKVTLGTPPVNSFLAYNETSVAKDVALPTGTWVTISDGSNYTGTISIEPYSSEILTIVVPDYYVSSSEGSDSNDGLTELTAYATVQQLITDKTLVAGDIVGLKGGDEFKESVTISSVNGTVGNPITFTSYGTDKAIIKGSKDITGWSNQGSNVWSVSTGVDDALQVFKDESNLLNARMPLISAKETPSNSYYNVTTIYGVSNRFLSTDLIDLGLSVGSTVNISSREWTLEARTITAFNNSTGEVTLDSDTQYLIEVGANFFVNNDIVLLTEQDEWYYNSSTNTLYMYSATEPTGISISTVDDDAITITNSDYISFDNITINHFNNNAFEVSGSDYLTLSNLELNYNYFQAANVDNSTYFSFTDNVVKGSNEEVIRLESTSTDANITGNEFTDCGILANITSKSVRQPNGIYSAGDRLNLELNTYSNIGYLGVFWIGEDSTITKNVFEGYCQALEDGGAIYSHNGNWADVGATGSVVSNNICLSTAFTDGWYANGLYTDERCHDIIFRDNTVVNGRYGIYLHNNKRIEHDGNNMYNQADYGIHIREDAVGGEGETVDNNIHHNNIFELISNVECAFYRSTYSIPSTGIFGTYDYNNYWNPQYTNLDTLVLANSATQFMTLLEWQTASGEDLNSSENPSLWVGGEQSQILYNDTQSTKDFILTGTWYDLDGTMYSSQITLQPFTSIILTDQT